MAISVRQMVITLAIYSFAVTGIVTLIYFGNTNSNQSKTVPYFKKRLFKDSFFESNTESYQTNFIRTSESTSSDEITAITEAFSRSPNSNEYDYPGTDTVTRKSIATSSDEYFPGTDRQIWTSNTTTSDNFFPVTLARESNRTTTAGPSEISTPERPATDNLTDCPEFSPFLKGRLEVDAYFVPSEQKAIENAGPYLNKGGCYEPVFCKTDQTVAIIIPYKNREKHLYTLLYHLHPMVQRQWVRYCVFVAEQYDDGAFNKARIMNAAFLEISKDPRKFDCIIFHDVDMLPEDDRNIYKCADTVKHLSPALDKFNYKVNYGTHFGGVGAVRAEIYKVVNGHSNRFYGWGGEDSDIERRYESHNLTTVWNEEYGRYKMIPHEHPWYFDPRTGMGSFMGRVGVRRFEEDRKYVKRIDPSGVNSTKYSLITTKIHPLYTKMTLDVRTILVNKASVKFIGHADIAGVENPWFTNSRLGVSYFENKTRGYSLLARDRFPNNGCYYKRFEGKTVNRTLLNKTDETFTNLETAKKRCTELGLNCQSIVEVTPNVYSLRAFAFMHELILQYRMGLTNPKYVTEIHTDVSVHAKICPNDARYQQFIQNPVIIYGSPEEGPIPSHQLDLELQLYQIEDIVLTYTIKVYTAHKEALREREFAHDRCLRIYDSLSVTYENSVVIGNLSNAKNMKSFLPEGVDNLEELLAKNKTTIRLKSPPIDVPRIPGCYICTSTITDQTGAPHLTWKWWYELRGSTKYMDKMMTLNQMINGEIGTTKLTEGVVRWLKWEAAEAAKKKKNEMVEQIEKLGLVIPQDIKMEMLNNRGGKN